MKPFKEQAENKIESPTLVPVLFKLTSIRGLPVEVAKLPFIPNDPIDTTSVIGVTSKLISPNKINNFFSVPTDKSFCVLSFAHVSKSLPTPAKATACSF